MLNSIKAARAAALGLALSTAVAGAAFAATAPATPSFPNGKPDITLAPAGNYKLDSQHAAVVAQLKRLVTQVPALRALVAALPAAQPPALHALSRHHAMEHAALVPTAARLQS